MFRCYVGVDADVQSGCSSDRRQRLIEDEHSTAIMTCYRLYVLATLKVKLMRIRK